MDVSGSVARLRAAMAADGSTAAPPTPDAQPPVPAGPAVYRVEHAGRRVALTFDDGPNGATTDAIVATLNRHHVDATFFVVGSNASGQRARLRRMHEAGHVIANHTWSHPQLTGLTNEQIREQLTSTSRVIRRATGESPDIFRAPYGARDSRVDRVARRAGMRDIIWDVDTRDWSLPGSDSIIRHAVNDARNGSIILMHDGGGDRSQTQAAVGKVIRGLRHRGFELVTVPELIDSGAS
jgi:peptidoglycan/xylan/chitin deacetylase (PgdA/CDA1 family)